MPTRAIINDIPNEHISGNLKSTYKITVMLKKGLYIPKGLKETVTNPKANTKGISDEGFSQNCSVDTRKHIPQGRQ